MPLRPLILNESRDKPKEVFSIYLVHFAARTIKHRPGRSSARDPETPSCEEESSREPSDCWSRPVLPSSDEQVALGDKVPRAPDTIGHRMPASTSKARKVMQWFRSCSKGHDLDDDGEASVPLGRKPSYDVHIIAYTLLFRIVNKFHQEVFPDPTEWAERFERDLDLSDAACEFRVKLLLFYTNYARLVMFSFELQNAFQRGFEANDEVFFTRVRDSTPSCIVGVTPVFFKSLESAKTVVTMERETLGHFALSKTNVEIGYFVFAAFALAFMLKLLRPECSRFIIPGLETEVYQVIERLIAMIGSPQIAIDERHTPKFYSRFLPSLLAKRKRDGTAQGRMPRQGPPP
ncbi:hypothetical protein F5148DRAFT_1282500 [Russula earlei]|uniref:Uncharacterized protein n=1 Tax=Russula earlei TaxID=71964 RepID=A0ACC0UE49_9AGAM|nr:hypothetical protein F5148DRAFT_1282500 [Russula earlei]